MSECGGVAMDPQNAVDDLEVIERISDLIFGVGPCVGAF
jgi:hypothetical protein